MSASLLRLLEAPAELPEMPELASMFDFGGHMDARREAAIELIAGRVRTIQEAGLGLTLGDLTLVIRDAFQMGASAAVDGMTARESARMMAELDALERREKQVQKMRAFPAVMVLERPMPLWPPVAAGEGETRSGGEEEKGEGAR
jgi:hypothetical protein